jgi:hypothetical protein
VSEKLEVATIDAHLTGVVLPMGLKLDEAVIRGQGLHLVKEPFSIQLNEPGSLEVKVGESSLEQFLESQAPAGLRDFEVQLRDGRIFAKASIRMILEVRGLAICRLRIEGGKRLMVDLESVDVLGVGARNLLQAQLDQINPVLDADDLPVDATLTEVAIEDGNVVLRGTVLPRQ